MSALSHEVLGVLSSFGLSAPSSLVCSPPPIASGWIMRREKGFGKCHPALVFKSHCLDCQSHDHIQPQGSLGIEVSSGRPWIQAKIEEPVVLQKGKNGYLEQLAISATVSVWLVKCGYVSSVVRNQRGGGNLRTSNIQYPLLSLHSFLSEKPP